MTQFKVGDRVRCIKADFRDLTVGKEYIVARLTDGGYADGVEVLDDKGDFNAWGYYELVDAANDELAKLRAWRDAAIAKHPDLAPPEPETDEAAAKRFEEEWFENDDWTEIEHVAAAAIAWARANPRST